MMNNPDLEIRIPSMSITEDTLSILYQKINVAARKYGLVYSWKITTVEITGDEYIFILIPHQIPVKVGETGNLFDVQEQHELFSENLKGMNERIDTLKSSVRNALRRTNNELINLGATISTNSAQAAAPTEISKKLNDVECDLEIEALIKNSVIMPNGNLMSQIDSITGLPKKNSRKKNLTLIPPLEFRDLTQEIHEIDSIRIKGIIRSGTDLSKNEVEIDEMTACKLIINVINKYLSILNFNLHNLPDNRIPHELTHNLEDIKAKIDINPKES